MAVSMPDVALVLNNPVFSYLMGLAGNASPYPDPYRPVEVALWSDQKRAQVEALLRRGRELIARGWLTQLGAANEAGEAVPVLSQDATRFCAQGAINRAAHDLNLHVVRQRASELMQWQAGCPLPVFNDRQWRVEPVLELFDRAIRTVSVGK